MRKFHQQRLRLANLYNNDIARNACMFLENKSNGPYGSNIIFSSLIKDLACSEIFGMLLCTRILVGKMEFGFISLNHKITEGKVGLELIIALKKLTMP